MVGIRIDWYSEAMNRDSQLREGAAEDGRPPSPTAATTQHQQDAGPRKAEWPVRRHKRTPILLFAVTLLSTFWAGACSFAPEYYLFGEGGSSTAIREVLLVGWANGLVYMAAVIAILLSHELGHYLATVYYRIPASYPMFLPFPLSPIGTLGAVIGMDGKQADRRQIFDIGIAGPLAGLVVALPILWIGILQLDLSTTPSGPWAVDLPPLISMMTRWIHPQGYDGQTTIVFSQLTPLFMAGWVGLLITGLNMMPVSQLDGGHVLYTLFGRRSYWIARGFMVFCVAYIVFAENYKLVVMVALVLLIGPEHPPTRDDSIKLGWRRTLLGWASLLIPILCFAPEIIVFRQ